MAHQQQASGSATQLRRELLPSSSNGHPGTQDGHVEEAPDQSLPRTAHSHRRPPPVAQAAECLLQQTDIGAAQHTQLVQAQSELLHQEAMLASVNEAISSQPESADDDDAAPALDVAAFKQTLAGLSTKEKLELLHAITTRRQANLDALAGLVGEPCSCAPSSSQGPTGDISGYQDRKALCLNGSRTARSAAADFKEGCPGHLLAQNVHSTACLTAITCALAHTSDRTGRGSTCNGASNGPQFEWVGTPRMVGRRRTGKRRMCCSSLAGCLATAVVVYACWSCNWLGQYVRRHCKL